jgi:hypothetical protein
MFGINPADTPHISFHFWKVVAASVEITGPVSVLDGRPTGIMLTVVVRASIRNPLEIARTDEPYP